MLESNSDMGIDITVNGKQYFLLNSMLTGKLLGLARFTAGLEIEQAARLLDMSEDYLEEIEAGWVYLTPDLVSQILSTYEGYLDHSLDKCEKKCFAHRKAKSEDEQSNEQEMPQ